MNVFKKLITIACVFISVGMYGQPVTDATFFSFNRGLQLYAFLESVEKYVTGINQASVIYRADSDEHNAAYEIVKERFPSYTYFRQGANPREDFKPYTLNASFNLSNAPFIMYGVDDIVVKDYVDLTQCACLMQIYDAYAFYLRLGKNLTDCYSLHQAQPLPPLTDTDLDAFAWHFNTGTGDWGYPHSVDMTLLRKADIKNDFMTMTYHSPNTLEAQWASCAWRIMGRIGLCYELSKIVNFPLNLVQNDWNNRHMTEYTPEQLLTIFMDGKKMDIEPVHQMYNPGAHTEYSPTFVERE